MTEAKKNNLRIAELLQDAFPAENIKWFYTHSLGFLIYSLMTCTGCKTYYEFGVGFGATALLAGMALKETCGSKNPVCGLDKRDNRLKRARAYLDSYGVSHELQLLGYHKLIKALPDDWRYDAIFCDVGVNDNQQVIDVFGARTNKLIFAHDVHGKLRWPDGFTPLYLPELYAAVAFKKQDI